MASEAHGRATRIVVVGAGLMGRWHTHAAERLGATVVAIVDRRREAAEALAARYGRPRVFADLDSALSEAEVDVVHVCTPVDSHSELIEAALRASCRALVEKPLASSLAETEVLLARAHERGLAVNPVHQFPFQPGFSGLLGRRERLGELVRVSYRTCSAGGDARSAEERRQLLLEILPHPASLLRHLFHGFEGTELDVVRYTEGDLDLTGQIGEARLDVSVSLRGRPTRNELELVGTRATALADLFHGYALVEGGGVSRPAKILRPLRLGGQLLVHASGNLGRRALRREPAYPGLRELIRRFHTAAVSGGEAPIPDAETLAAARLMERVRAQRS